MAVLRDRPYAQFNFLVDLGTGDTSGPEAGFQECSQIATSVNVIEYRNGNDKENTTRKIAGLNKSSDVTLKRGIIGSLNLYKWLDQVRNGDVMAFRNVVIQLQNEDRSAIVMTWKLMRAWPSRIASGDLDAKGNEVAMEEMTLTYERLEID